MLALFIFSYSIAAEQLLLNADMVCFQFNCNTKKHNKGVMLAIDKE